MRLICKCGEDILDDNIEIVLRENDEGEDYCELEARCTICKTDYIGQSEWGHVEDIEEAKQSLAEYHELTIKEPAV